MALVGFAKRFLSWPFAQCTNDIEQSIDGQATTEGVKKRRNGWTEGRTKRVKLPVGIFFEEGTIFFLRFLFLLWTTIPIHAKVPTEG